MTDPIPTPTPETPTADPSPTPTPAPATVKPPTPEPPDLSVAPDADQPAPPPQADPPKESPADDDIDSLKAKIAALEAAQTVTAKGAADASAEVERLKAEAVEARREAARTSIGLPPQFAALMPEGDPSDPKVAQAIEAFRGDPKYAQLFGKRSLGSGDVVADLNKRLGEKNSSIFSNPESRRQNWQRMKGGN